MPPGWLITRPRPDTVTVRGFGVCATSNVAVHTRLCERVNAPAPHDAGCQAPTTEPVDAAAASVTTIPAA
jgi:hypothetical protein